MSSFQKDSQAEVLIAFMTQPLNSQDPFTELTLLQRRGLQDAAVRQRLSVSRSSGMGVLTQAIF